MLAAGLLIALITPDGSLVGRVGVDASLLTETFRQAVGTVLTPMLVQDRNPLVVSSARRIHPLVEVAIPLAALIWTTRRQPHTVGFAPLVAVPFAVWMFVFARLGGTSDVAGIDVSAGNALALGFLWGLVGALIGVLSTRPPPENRLLAATRATLRPLAALLLVCTVTALVGWLIQVGRDSGGVRAGRSAPVALIEETAYGLEHGVHLTALAAGVRFRADSTGALGLPFPVERADDLPGGDGRFRILAYRDVLPAAVFLPAFVILVALTVLAAVAAGFAAARAVKPRSLAAAIAWGALTGPAWALAMTILAVLVGGYHHGDIDEISAFLIYLSGGALLGAAGGAISGHSSLESPAASS